ncbi:MAG TPA: C1 family peptidase [Caulobacterales bacterium]|nr:C1 family peptidase [Caulobacterales bacterium]
MPAKRQVRRYGWRPDLPDARDHLFALRRPRTLPASVSLRDKLGPVQDQGELGSCTAHAAEGAYWFLHPGCALSRLKLYYDERVIEGTVNEDAGAMIRTSVKALSKAGAAREALWPYDVAKFTRKPAAAAVKDGKRHTIAAYQRLAPSQYRACLAGGSPFIIGFSVYESFESDATASTGRVTMPKRGESMIGGHAICVVGYKKRWGAMHYECRNSWGADWGNAGYFWMPAAYLENLSLADDAWTVRS